MLSHPVLSLWPLVLKQLIAFSIPALLFVLMDQSYATIIAAILLALLFAWHFRWILPFCWRVRRFNTMRKCRIVLHTAPDRDATWSIDYFLTSCETELEKLSELFNCSIPDKVIVYLFAWHQQIGKIFGAKYGGLALPSCNAIVIADDNYPIESMRHEIAHLYAAKLSSTAPPLFQEGLAMWCQATHRGQHIDDHATLLVYATKYKLNNLLDSGFFFTERHRYHCYLLAGSFTSFLIGRYGWSAYRKFYRNSASVFLHWQFKRRFGLSLGQAEQQWRRKVVLNES